MKNLKTLVLILSFIYIFNTGAFAIEQIDISARAALLADPVSGEVIYEQNDQSKEYPASLTKLMTALLTIENGGLDEDVTVSETALEKLSDAGSTVGLQAGETLTVDQLLTCLLVASANEAANVLAEHVSGNIQGFVALMNKRANELGCVNTHFVNPHGLHSTAHYTCAYDMFLIAREILKHKRLTEICQMQKAVIPATNLSKERIIYSTNLLISPYKDRTYLYSPATGLKTGSTQEAGLCLVATAQKGNTQLLSVVLGAEENQQTSIKESFSETKRLFEWGFNNFTLKRLLDKSHPVAETKVKLAWDRDYVVAVAGKDINVLVPIDFNPKKLEIIPVVPRSITAPVRKGSVLGTVTFRYEDRDYAKVDLLAADSIKRSNILYFLDIIKKFFNSTFLKFSIILAISLAFLYMLMIISYNQSHKRKHKHHRRGYHGKRK